MGQNSEIAWTDHTFNPWWGCTKVSAGCEHCYAEGVANRFAPGLWGANGRRRFFGEKHWREVMRWNARAEKTGVPERVFCGSMCDVCERLPLDHQCRAEMAIVRAQLRSTIRHTPHLRWLLLTKRPEGLLQYFDEQWWRECPNTWAGVTAENQATADERIPLLLQVPAAKRFVSCEPLLSALDLSKYLGATLTTRGGERIQHPDHRIPTTGGTWDFGLDWVIAGCESGPGARHAMGTWFRMLRNQCEAAGVPHFLKQMMVDGQLVRMPKLDGKAWDEVPA